MSVDTSVIWLCDKLTLFRLAIRYTGSGTVTVIKVQYKHNLKLIAKPLTKKVGNLGTLIL